MTTPSPDQQHAPEDRNAPFDEDRGCYPQRPPDQSMGATAGGDRLEEIKQGTVDIGCTANWGETNWLLAEVAQLRADLARVGEALAVSEQQTADAEELWTADVRRLSAQVQAMRPVVEAAREVRDCHGETNLTARGHRRLKAALDQAQPQQQEVPD